MGALLWSKTTLVWIMLIGATTLSWELGHGFGFRSLKWQGSAIIVIAFVKARFVILEFMEIGRAPAIMRGAAEIWLVAICALLVILFLSA